jgi:phytoene dehydrogenase-like protein
MNPTWPPLGIEGVRGGFNRSKRTSAIDELYHIGQATSQGKGIIGGRSRRSWEEEVS